MTSPQGRFPDASLLDGCELDDVEAYGKHLFYWWRDAPIMHVHLGQRGLFLHHVAPAPEPRPQVRLRMAGLDKAVDLIAPLVCETLDTEGRERIVDRLGVDPLRPGADVDAVRRRLSASGAAIGAALLDQSVIAGVGNVLRAEALNISRIDPSCPARDLDDEAFDRLWRVLVETMERAARDGRIITAGPPDDEARAATPEAEGRYVYRQERCRRCGTPARQTIVGGRAMYACPFCQRPCLSGR